MNHIRVSVNGKTIVNEFSENSANFDRFFCDFGEHFDFSTEPTSEKNAVNDEMGYYAGMFGDVHPMKKNSWEYKFCEIFQKSTLLLIFIILIPPLTLLIGMTPIAIFALIKIMLGL